MNISNAELEIAYKANDSWDQITLQEQNCDRAEELYRKDLDSLGVYADPGPMMQDYERLAAARDNFRAILFPQDQ